MKKNSASFVIIKRTLYYPVSSRPPGIDNFLGSGESDRDAVKTFLSAEPTGVGRFLLSKFLILTFIRVNNEFRRKRVIQKL